MAKPRYVHIVDDVPELASLPEGRGPVLVYSLDGFLDAGNAGRACVDHMLGDEPGRVVASFEIDAFYDYRARRPPMTFVENKYRDYEAPRLVVRVCRDRNDTPYLLLSGPEPDTHWEAFARAVREVMDAFEVRVAVSLGAVPMAVPHTRPVMVTQHVTREEQVVQENLWKGEIRIPSSAMAMLELRLGEWGYNAMGFVAHVPHYLASIDYPAGAVKLVESLQLVTDLELDVEGLHAAADTAAIAIAAQIADSDDVRQVVEGLEQQYDAFHTDDETLPIAESRDLPTADELGAEFEKFLAGLDPDE
jgi:predicted ATP-grasp superfamily ATP-dependent carboligase